MLSTFSIIFVSIVLEALPFVFLGTLIASAIHLYVTPQRMQELMPTNPILAYLFGGIMGVAIPICECVSVPLLKQLLKKGVPVGVGITFMAAAPIVNPLVMASTWFAFSHDPSVFWWRIVGGFFGAIAVGVLFSWVLRWTGWKYGSGEGISIQAEEHHHVHTGNMLHDGMTHFIQEFTTICFYLIVGAFLASIAKVYLPVSRIDAISSNVLIEILLLQGLAFLLSLCSEADAFIARTFQGMFSNAAIVGFLLFGPMVDFKNTMMLRTIFSRKQIGLLIATVTVVTGLISVLYLTLVG